MITTSVRFLLSIFGLAPFLIVFDGSPTHSFRISTISTRTFPPSASSTEFEFGTAQSSPHSSSSRFAPPSISALYSGAQDANEPDDEDDTVGTVTAGDVGTGGVLVDAAGILGTVASIVVLRSEFVLKTTGCGLPAGPFGIVGAIEGISYLGVVATCAAAVVDFVSSDEDDSSSPKPTATVAKRVATALSVAAVVAGISVLAFQLTDYGYIPNAVPMEGGMCK